MTDFESIKHSFLAGSTMLCLMGAYFVFLAFSYPISKGFPTILPIFAVLFFLIWMKKNNPLYKMDRAERRNLIKPYQSRWGERLKDLLAFAFFAVMIATVWISLLLGAGALQALYIGLGLPIMIYGLVSLILSYRMQPKAG